VFFAEQTVLVAFSAKLSLSFFVHLSASLACADAVLAVCEIQLMAEK
jgi:hypothetical protein